MPCPLKSICPDEGTGPEVCEKCITHEGTHDVSFDKGEELWSCNDCGAFSFLGPDKIEHYDSCCPGESKMWQKVYSQEEDIDAGDPCPVCFCQLDYVETVLFCKGCGWKK